MDDTSGWVSASPTTTQNRSEWGPSCWDAPIKRHRQGGKYQLSRRICRWLPLGPASNMMGAHCGSMIRWVEAHAIIKQLLVQPEVLHPVRFVGREGCPNPSTQGPPSTNSATVHRELVEMTLSLLENMESGLATSSKSYRLLRYFILPLL